MAPMASPPQVRRDPPRAASATIAAAMQQRQPSISSVVASTNQNAYQVPRTQRAASGQAAGKSRAPLSKNRNIPSTLDDDSDDLDGFDSSDDDNLDIFYTPAQSPRTSMASSSIAFPSRARNTSPRQASRKSLRMSHASSGVVSGACEQQGGFDFCNYHICSGQSASSHASSCASATLFTPK
ncbi:hypothetical protein NMY22_g6716 [Coprinellus aureogranulatus]|nr:hypothetical protein NMY22_g6716 [Coprinellus aureogranulatus]